MNRRNLPNIISALRILLVFPVIVLLVRQEFGLALAVFVVAGLSDAVDGYLARRYGWATPLGGWLDPIADKTMMVSTYLVLAWLGLIPPWLFAAVVARDAIIVVGSLLYYYWVEQVEAEPSWISKLNTVMQILLVILVMFDRVVALPELWLTTMFFVVLATVTASGLGYIIAWGMRALHVKRDAA